tara:strand:- start:525 stop:782 length:258 start_codon:yes stop_codon:yes gene_type:complete
MTEQQKNYSKSLVLIDMLIENIDDIKENLTPEMKLIRLDLDSLQNKIIPLVDEIYKNKFVRKSTFYQILQEKFNYNLDRELKKYK